MAGRTFVALVNFTKRSRGVELLMLGRNNQARQTRTGGGPSHAEQRRGDRVKILGGKVKFRHARGWVHRGGVGNLSLDIRDQVARNFRIAKLQLRRIFSAEAR